MCLLLNLLLLASAAAQDVRPDVPCGKALAVGYSCCEAHAPDAGALVQRRSVLQVTSLSATAISRRTTLKRRTSPSFSLMASAARSSTPCCARPRLSWSIMGISAALVQACRSTTSSTGERQDTLDVLLDICVAHTHTETKDLLLPMGFRSLLAAE